MADSRNAATRNRQIRQEALRDQLQTQGHLQHVIDISGKLSDEAINLDREIVNRYKIVLETKLKLINKYLPDLKAVEVTGEGGGPVEHDHHIDLESALAVLNEHGVDTSHL
jgi:hypothetical protein